MCSLNQNDLDSSSHKDENDIVHIPRGTMCFLDLERLAQEDDENVPPPGWKKEEFWDSDEFWVVDKPTPPPPTTLPEKAVAFLAELGYNELYSTQGIRTLRDELTTILEHLATCDFKPVVVALLLALEMPRSSIFTPLFKSLTFQERRNLITFLLEEMGTHPKSEVEQSAEKFLMVAASVHLLAQFKRLQQAQTWNELRPLCNSDCRVT